MQISPVSISPADALHGNWVRFECPVELNHGSWDGPVYAWLREPRYVRADQSNSFIVDDCRRHPGWVCDCEDPTPPARPDVLVEDWTNAVVPYSRLTPPFDNLFGESTDRPLLLLFRYVCCYVTAGSRSNPARLVEVFLEVYLNDQVVAYRSGDRYTFTTQHEATLILTSKYVCIVVVRQPVTDTPIYVGLPCHTVWIPLISREGVVVGWYHGTTTHCNSSFGFLPTGSDTPVDLGIVPLEFTKANVGSASATTRIIADEASDTERPADISATGFSRDRPLPPDDPAFSCLDRLPLLTSPAPVQWIPFAALNADTPQVETVDSGSTHVDEHPQAAVPSTRPSHEVAPTRRAYSIGSNPLSTQQMVALTQQRSMEQRDRQLPPVSPTVETARQAPISSIDSMAPLPRPVARRTQQIDTVR
ncbi:LOW QUALITY PROTEIN: hypothetical protein PHMEG_00010398 [Phytophthora megakarya]|uniref:Uncharacterized protein n=1 Tax=Phytophthora megakarya TaxID=4795 RepID=A0A225WED4_9STRA|nr:LOW QUALITY PROTEIN: hypothetical protein PHMEG_00010398 [Phytophthora megakarya]